MLDKVLFVDDEPSFWRATKRMLHREFEVDTAVSGEQGLTLIRDRGPYSVVISDMRMPGMNGAQFLAAGAPEGAGYDKNAADRLHRHRRGNGGSQPGKHLPLSRQAVRKRRFWSEPSTPGCISTGWSWSRGNSLKILLWGASRC